MSTRSSPGPPGWPWQAGPVRSSEVHGVLEGCLPLARIGREFKDRLRIPFNAKNSVEKESIKRITIIFDSCSIAEDKSALIPSNPKAFFEHRVYHLQILRLNTMLRGLSSGDSLKTLLYKELRAADNCHILVKDVRDEPRPSSASHG